MIGKLIALLRGRQIEWWSDRRDATQGEDFALRQKINAWSRVF